MPPKKKQKTSIAVRNGSVSSEDSAPAASKHLSMANTYPEAVGQLIRRVQNATQHNCAMFKLDVASGGPADLERSAVAVPSDISQVTPLCVLTEADVPGGSGLFQPRQYAEALQQAVRAHFAFVERDRRLIWTGLSVPRDSQAAQWTLYLFNYLRSPLQRAASAATPAKSAEANRRRTMAVPALATIEQELDKFKHTLDRAERELLNVSRSHEQELRLPVTPPSQISLQEPPRRSLGTALHTVLPRVAGASGHDGRTPRKRGRAHSPELSDTERMDTVDGSLTAGSAGDASSASSERSAASSRPSTSGSTPSKVAPLAEDEAAQLTDFYFSLNGVQTEQARVSLTCRYAKLRYGRDVPAGAVYRLVERSGRAAPPPPPPLSADQEREMALSVFSELEPGQTEQSRVAYTLQYMRVQHACKITANVLFGWLGQATKKPAKTRR